MQKEGSNWNPEAAQTRVQMARDTARTRNVCSTAGELGAFGDIGVALANLGDIQDLAPGEPSDDDERASKDDGTEDERRSERNTPKKAKRAGDTKAAKEKTDKEKRDKTDKEKKDGGKDEKVAWFN